MVELEGFVGSSPNVAKSRIFPLFPHQRQQKFLSPERISIRLKTEDKKRNNEVKIVQRGSNGADGGLEGETDGC